ncbi:MAG: DNA helicase UvrBC [Treponema sp.]|nr:DNA helicase UvrBC [Treponema sp.]
MKCDDCKNNEAIILFRQINGNKTLEFYLCEQCAKLRSFTKTDNQNDLSLKNLLHGLMNVEGNKVCSVCSTSLQSIQKYKKVGCSECYEAFKEDIKKIMQNEGIEGPYIGSLPKKILHFKSNLTDRNILRTKLEQAVANEDYEKAATYRDRLKFLENPPIECDDITEIADPDILMEGGNE